MPGKITKRTIDALRAEAKAQAKTRYLFDSEYTGFGALSTKEGKCSYFVQYRLGGVSKRMTIGKHGALTPDEARKLAKEKLGEVARGTDVAQAKRDAREKLTGLTLHELIERFLSLHAKPTRYWKEKRARLLSDDLKALHGKPAALIKQGEIAAVIDKVQPRSHAAALLLFADIRPIFAWALGRAAIETNPMAGMKGPKLLKVRDRVLDPAEIKALWQAATEQSWPFENVIKLLLLTGQRKSEVAGMRWGELDLDGEPEWTIAKERCKNGKAHTIDLHPEAVALLDRLGEPAAARRASDEEFVFSTTGVSPVAAFSDAKLRIDARMKELLGKAFKPWRIHDLRRTAASGMAALGFQPHVIERVLNHLSGVQRGLVSVYQRHEYREERKRAIFAWGDEVMRLVGNAETSNIVPLRVA